MELLLEDIREGNFDYQLVRPTDAMLLVSIRRVQIWRVLDLFIGGGVLVYAAIDISGQIGWVEAAAFLATVLLGAFMIYCIYLMVTTWAFRVIAMNEIMELFQGVYQAGRWPVTLYPIWPRSSLTYIVPLAFAVTVPAEALSGKSSWVVVFGAAAFAAALFAVTRWVWDFNMKKYSGASA